MNDFDEEDLRDDGQVEFADLPVEEEEEEERSISGQLFRQSSRLGLRVHISPRTSLWRLAMAGSTICLALLLFLGSFPSTRAWTYNLFVHPTPDTTYASSLTEETSQIGIGQDVSPSWQATAEVWDTNATPGPVPQGQNCLASPVYGSAQEMGRPPAIVVGFDAPRATLHLSPIPVPVSVFPHKFGWAASLAIEIPSDYTGLILLRGKRSSDGLPLVFGFGRDPSQEQWFSLTLSTHQAMVSPGLPGMFKAWRPTWNITMYIPTAGCYLLQAAWPGGSWSIKFAAGR